MPCGCAVARRDENLGGAQAVKSIGAFFSDNFSSVFTKVHDLCSLFFTYFLIMLWSVMVMMFHRDFEKITMNPCFYRVTSHVFRVDAC